MNNFIGLFSNVALLLLLSVNGSLSADVDEVLRRLEIALKQLPKEFEDSAFIIVASDAVKFNSDGLTQSEFEDFKNRVANKVLQLFPERIEGGLGTKLSHALKNLEYVPNEVTEEEENVVKDAKDQLHRENTEKLP